MENKMILPIFLFLSIILFFVSIWEHSILGILIFLIAIFLLKKYGFIDMYGEIDEDEDEF